MSDDFESHPLFATSVPDNLENNEAFAAIQEMIYEDPPNVIATNFKNNADDFLKQYNEHKKRVFLKNSIHWYDKALLVEGLTDEHIDVKILILSNRSQAHLYAGNHRSALNDAQRVLGCNPAHVKAAYRGMTAAVHLRKPQIALEIYQHLSKNTTSIPKTITSLKDQALSQIKELETIYANRKALAEAKANEEAEYRSLLQSLDIKLSNLCVSNVAEEYIQDDKCLWRSENDLCGKIVLLYPEYNTSDFLRDVSLMVSPNDLLSFILDERPSWDEDEQYKPEKCALYYRKTEENVWDGKWTMIHPEQPIIASITISKLKYTIPKVLTFYVLPTNTKYAREFLQA
ncbi:hypothetical protein RCL1_006680 [Eukaryota sp. TZLM3-RCL]